MAFYISSHAGRHSSKSSTQVFDHFSVIADSHSSAAVSDAQQHLSFHLHLPQQSESWSHLKGKCHVSMDLFRLGCKTTGGKLILPTKNLHGHAGRQASGPQSWWGSLNFFRGYVSAFSKGISCSSIRYYLFQVSSLLVLEHPHCILWKEHWRKAERANSWGIHRNI